MTGGERRKFQVCNGYLLEFDQLARVLDCMAAHKDEAKISREMLMEGTGLSNRQIESLVSIGSAMGVIQRGRQTLSPMGALLAKHDVFMEQPATLEWCHYQGAGTARNLVWFEIFNSLLPSKPPLSTQGWMDCLRDLFRGQYTDRTIGKHLHEEVRFVADAYLARNFKKLQLLYEGVDGKIARRRHAEPQPEMLAAMLYDYGERQKTRLLQVNELVELPGTPGLLVAMDEGTLRERLEDLHGRGWVRLETTHNLNQVRLLEGFGAVAFLSAFYEQRTPVKAGRGAEPREQTLL